MAEPEAHARQEIDRLLEAAGRVVQDREAFNRNAAPGVAVREFPLPAGFAEQTAKYVTALPPHLTAHRTREDRPETLAFIAGAT